LDSIVESVLQEYERANQQQDGRPAVHGCGVLPFRTERPSGALLNLLVREAMASVIVEVGSGCGYYTLCLAEAARETGGRVIAIEEDAKKVEEASAMLARTRLSDRVEFRIGDSLQRLSELEARVDFALIGGPRERYVACFELLTRRLGSGAVVVADRMIYPDGQVAESERYRRRIRSSGDFESVLLPVGAGLEVARYYGD